MGDVRQRGEHKKKQASANNANSSGKAFPNARHDSRSRLRMIPISNLRACALSLAIFRRVHQLPLALHLNHHHPLLRIRASMNGPRTCEIDARQWNYATVNPPRCSRGLFLARGTRSSGNDQVPRGRWSTSDKINGERGAVVVWRSVTRRQFIKAFIYLLSDREKSYGHRLVRRTHAADNRFKFNAPREDGFASTVDAAF